MAIIPTIEQESKQRIRVPYDIDNFTERYNTLNGYYTFPSSGMWAIQKNFFYLLKNSRRQSFDLKYKTKPDILSFDEYGTVILSPILMLVNNIMCIEEFSMDYVLIPSKDSIVDICKDKFLFKDLTKLTLVDI